MRNGLAPWLIGGALLVLIVLNLANSRQYSSTGDAAMQARQHSQTRTSLYDLWAPTE